MFCPSCRANNAEGAVFCGSCGARMAADVAAAPQKTSGLAIASLVLGVLGFCCGLFSITGLILGIVGLLKIGRSAGQLGGKGLAIAGICVSGVAFMFQLMMPAILMPALYQALGEPRKPSCMKNLQQVGLGFTMYLNDHRGEFPATLDDLVQYAGKPQLFVCPADSHPMATPSGLRTSYHYVGRLSLNTQPLVIVMYDKRKNHPDARNMLLMDGSVRFLPEKDFASRLKESFGLVKQHWDEYSPERQAAIEAFYEDRMPE